MSRFLFRYFVIIALTEFRTSYYYRLSMQSITDSIIKNDKKFTNRFFLRSVTLLKAAHDHLKLLPDPSIYRVDS